VKNNRLREPVDISVIVPTYNDGRRLTKCVDALRNQDFRGTYEIIIVDNGSLKDPPKVEADRLVTLIHESTPGSYSARNTGILASGGKLLAFTDSDCIPERSWLSSAFEACTAREISLWAGRIDIFFKDPRRPTSSELYERYFSFRQKTNVAQGWAVTANLFVRRSVFEQIGLFDAGSYSGGDAEFTRRAVRSGHRLVYLDEGVVLHPARRELRELRQMRRRHVGGFYRLSKAQPEYAKMFSVAGMLKDLALPLKSAGELFRDLLRRRVLAVDALRILAVVVHVQFYRAAIKLLYKFRLRSSFERQ